MPSSTLPEYRSTYSPHSTNPTSPLPAAYSAHLASQVDSQNYTSPYAAHHTSPHTRQPSTFSHRASPPVLTRTMHRSSLPPSQSGYRHGETNGFDGATSPTVSEHARHRSGPGLNGMHRPPSPSSQGTIDEDTHPTTTAISSKSPIDSSAQLDPKRRSDPMSFSNILSNDVPLPTSQRQLTPKNSITAASQTTNGEVQSEQPLKTVATNIVKRSSVKTAASPKYFWDQTLPARADMSSANSTKVTASAKKKPAFAKDDERVLIEMAKIEALPFSVDAKLLEEAEKMYEQDLLVRAAALAKTEETKRKLRRIAMAQALTMQINVNVNNGKRRFREEHEAEAMAQVHEKDVQDEKKRKKDMQRKRRREKALQTQAQIQQDAVEKAAGATDAAEKLRHIKEAQRAEKKVRSTKRILERADDPDASLDISPLAPNLDGGLLGSFQTGELEAQEPPRKKPKMVAGTRPKKSKEKRDAEKAKAEAGFAAGMHNKSPGYALKKEESPSRGTPRAEREARKSNARPKRGKKAAATSADDVFTSKGYNQLYDQIWKDIARKEIPKVWRIKENSHNIKLSNSRKTAQLASKEARRWQWRTNKGNKDIQARAKRSMREMMSFWKQNERAERDLRKNAERAEIDAAKRADADRESNRQKRKLNFLLEQTELYSHFIGRKIKTDEVERSTDSAEVKETAESSRLTTRIDLPDDTIATSKVTTIDQLDFDADDDSTLKAAAIANAQNAVAEAQAKARAFNQGDKSKASVEDEDGEMNFQNPTGMGDINIAQPKMLTAQLKEYQLKGLNWLVNLYEQGINGILADEMGLGKTIQSISVMGYLAEKYDVWGPFLVIAPASTLHNWQQEITRFVPNLKCLPYWGSAKDRKVLRKFWDRKHITYTKDSPFHVLITSYQLVVGDSQYFQKMRWQYMILDEAQAIKSSSSSRWKSLLGFHCRNRLLLTGTPIQNNMQELWALLHFIMPSLFDSHDEFSEWFSKDIESHAQSNTKLNEDQLKRLHMILKPFMLRRVKKHVQRELGDKVEIDVFCDLTYRQRAYYTSLRNKISLIDFIERAAGGDEQDTATLMNLVMQFRKVCNHPDLFERADTSSPFAMVHFAETASFMREGNFINVDYSTRNAIDYDMPRLLSELDTRLSICSAHTGAPNKATHALHKQFNIWSPDNVRSSLEDRSTFHWLRFADTSIQEAHTAAKQGLAERAILLPTTDRLGRLRAIYEDDIDTVAPHSMFNIVQRNNRKPLAEITCEGHLASLMNVSATVFNATGLTSLEQCARPGASAPPIGISCSDQWSRINDENTKFNIGFRKALYGISEKDEFALIEAKVDPEKGNRHDMLPAPLSERNRYTNISVPSMRRFVTDSGKLAKLDELLRGLKEGGHRVLLYFQMTRMIDLMEEYLTFRNYKFLRLDGSTKLEDRRDTVADFQTKPENFIFLLSTRAGGLGINLTAADTVIFYDSDWNPTIDSQAMDRAHRLGQTRQVTVYRLITRSTIEERIRKRALQKEEVQRVVISGGAGGTGTSGVDFNTRSKETRTKDIAMWLADDEEAALIEKKEAELAAARESAQAAGATSEKRGRKKAAGLAVGGRKAKEVSMDDMYHEGEGHFEDGSAATSGGPAGANGKPAADGLGERTHAPASTGARKKGISKKAKTTKQRLAIADGGA